MPIASNQPAKQITVKHPSLVRCQGRRCCPRPNCSSMPLRSCKIMYSELTICSLIVGLDGIIGAVQAYLFPECLAELLYLLAVLAVLLDTCSAQASFSTTVGGCPFVG